MNNKQHKTIDSKRLMWQKPWKYKEGFLITITILLIGFLLEIVNHGRGIQIPEFPLNFVVAIIFISIVLILHFVFPKSSLVVWLSSVPAAITSSTLITVIVLAMGFTEQNHLNVPEIFRLLGLSNITKSYFFALAQIFLMLSLGLVVLKRIKPYTTKNFGFILNHLGLFVILLAASLGTGDIQKLTMILEKGNDFSNQALTPSKKMVLMPIALKLNDFRIDEYNPKAVFIKTITHEIIQKLTPQFIEIQENATFELFDWHFVIDTFFMSAMVKEQGYIKYLETGAFPAAKVTITNKKTNKRFSEWLSCGSYMFPLKTIKLDDNFSLAMTSPEPKKFISYVDFRTIDGENGSTSIEVNKPLKINGWKIYQMGYNSKLGRWSNTSTLELIKDPWLPVVYIGFFMVLAGSIYLFWIGTKNKDSKNTIKN